MFGMNIERYIDFVESIKEESKLIRKEIEESKGELEFDIIQKFVNEKFNSFLSKYEKKLHKLDEYEAYHFIEMISIVFNRTYFRKFRVQVMKKNGAKFNDGVNTLLKTFEEFKIWEKRFEKVDLINFVQEFAQAKIFLQAGRETEGHTMFEELRKYSKELKGTDKSRFLYIIEDQLDVFIFDKREKILNRLRLQYEFITQPYLKMGYKMEFPDMIQSYQDGELVSGQLGEYDEIFHLIKNFNNDVNQAEFDSIYKEILKETDLNSVLEKVNIKFLQAN